MTWLRDSKYLFSVAGFPTSDFLRVDTETGETFKLDTGERSGIFGWAPDISVVYKGLGDFNMPNQRIVARDMKTGQEREIYHSAVASRFSLRAISPDGRWLAFARLVFKEGGAQDYEDLLMVPAGGGAAREILKLPAGAGGVNQTGWSADSKFLYYSVYQQKKKMWQVAVDGGEPAEARLPLGEFSNKFTQLSFSRDDKRVAFMASSSGPWEV
jgi:Tol biopolymer transport system component